MASWLVEYMDALAARDTTEKSQLAIIENYTQLADRAAALQSDASRRDTAPAEPISSSPSPRPPKPTGKEPRGKDTADNVEAALTQLRADLATTQKSRAELQAKLEPLTKELAALKAAGMRDRRKIEGLGREKAVVERKLEDRNMELKAKAKLVEDVQDEMLSLNLQLNVAEAKSQKLRDENKELVDRWMARMGQEADAMNERSKWS
ncbi:putative autophagy protein Apg16 [Eremomyces bilateralis CBS 781.70]|uniref:Autophagy protein Apg16 n=1 Tax=Eremomyces bilateralis CBS 781.70 TaxID=1392243 RepID=A0A6G1G429_9PEZI|nr:putative autophagy protein Apg16 [Eremomyces bilateralis CBS 781.70]KAF1812847.1 putative autophagy protein Apg16 [Eremomyces bilateralis CBS 781.70]